jgi:hypothetical protein
LWALWPEKFARRHHVASEHYLHNLYLNLSHLSDSINAAQTAAAEPVAPNIAAALAFIQKPVEHYTEILSELGDGMPTRDESVAVYKGLRDSSGSYMQTAKAFESVDPTKGAVYNVGRSIRLVIASVHRLGAALDLE